MVVWLVVGGKCEKTCIILWVKVFSCVKDGPKANESEKYHHEDEEGDEEDGHQELLQFRHTHVTTNRGL